MNASSFEKLQITVDAIAESMKHMATKDDLKSLEGRLEAKIDDLAIAVSHEFRRVHGKIDGVTVRLDSLEKNVVEFRTLFDLKSNGFQHQLDNIYLNHTWRSEHVKLEKRVKRLERVTV